MRSLRIGVFVCGWLLAATAVAALWDDVARFPVCERCGMDRGRFSYSRMLIVYEDGTQSGTCSLHCAAVELANAFDKMPQQILVADLDTLALLDAEEASWVIGGNLPGVMTGRPKWAFGEEEAAADFVQTSGGVRATFREAIAAAYDDIYEETKALRDFRRLLRESAEEN